MSVDLLDPGRPEHVAGELAERFAVLHGRPADGVHVAPGRVNLIGEHVDYNGGRCLPYALPHSTYVAAAARDDDTVTVRSLQMDEAWTGRLDALGPGEVSGWVSYVAGVIWALRADGIAVPGLDLVLDSRVPVGAGLSSSAALECSVALAALQAAGVDLDAAVRDRVVAACVRAENEVAGASTGGMDQSVAVHATAGHALLLDFAGGAHRQVPWDPEGAGLRLLIVDTRVHHALNDGGYASRRQDCETAARLLGVAHLAEVDDLAALSALPDERLRRRARHVVTEVARVDAAVEHLERGDVSRAGRAVPGFARIPARRLRGVLRGARPGGVHRAGARCPRRPDDRRRFRGLGDRPGPGGPGGGGRGRGGRRLHRARLEGAGHAQRDTLPRGPSASLRQSGPPGPSYATGHRVPSSGSASVIR